MSIGNKTITALSGAFCFCAILTAGGCSTLTSLFDDTHVPVGQQAATPRLRIDPARQLEQARLLIRNGEDEPARKLLVSITTEQSVVGVTDEALFHLSLLTMKEETEASGYPQSRQILERLFKEYPTSIWGVEAESLNDLLMGRWLTEVNLGKAKRQVKTLKDSNVSLSRENKELRLNIEKLKNLDLELEQKSRR